MSVINSIPLIAAGDDGYQISRSVRLRSSASAYFSRTPASASGYNQWTYSCWVKRGALGSTQYIIGGNTLTSGTVRNVLIVAFDSTDTLTIYAFNNSSGYYFQRVSSAVFRDPSAWYHLVVQFDPDNGTSANKFIAYINGQQVSWATSSDSGVAGNTSSSAYRSINNTYRNDINGGYQGGGVPVYFGDGYQTECNMVSGSIVAHTAFGETDAVTGVWKPKRYTGTYGTNGFYLNFSDNSAATAAAIGKDSSGNGNNWTPNNISVTSGSTYDSMLDTPTPYADGGNGRGNYCVMNPLKNGGITVSNGNLTVTGSASSTTTVVGSIGFTSGKWYWEYTVGSTDQNSMIGICTDSVTLSNWVGSDAYGWAYYGISGNKLNGGTSTAYGASYTNGDVIGVSFDADSGTLTFYKNNTSQGTAYTGLTSGPYFPAFGDSGTAATPTGSFNFGQRPFTYTPPTGFKALNTQNLSAGSITTSGSFTGNASADGPFVYLNGVPTAMTINGNAVTFATHVDKTANGFKLRTSSSSYNASGSNTYSITTTGAKFKYANAQVNP